jgi:hypothetical protein
LVEPSNIYFARMSNKTKLLLCNLFLYAHAKLFLYKWKLISLLAVNIYPSIHQFLVPSILMICENWSFLPLPYCQKHFLQFTNFPWIRYLLWINSWMMTFQQASVHDFIGILDCRYLQVNLWMHFLQFPVLRHT